MVFVEGREDGVKRALRKTGGEEDYRDARRAGQRGRKRGSDIA
jgi:hypothetical protein